MFRLSIRASQAILLLALAASACVDEQNPLEPEQNTTGQPSDPRFGFGDTYVVTNTNDSGLGSLRWALSFTTGFETITFDPGIAGQTITVDSQLVVPYAISIEGPAGKGMTISGGGKTRVFNLTHGGCVILQNLTIANGNSGAEPGAGVFNDPADKQCVSLKHVTLTGNVAPGGAAVVGYNVGLNNSTASGNTSTYGGAVVFASSHLHITNSTVAYNTGKGVGGGEVLHLVNAIVSNNSNRSCGNFIYGIKYETASNISDDDSCGGPGEITIANPMLGALADNGGPNKTHALLVGSPAINAGTKCDQWIDHEVDQRYVPRDTACDLGAFEFIDFTTITLVVDPSPAINPITKFAVVTGTMQCTRDETFDVAVALKQEQKTSRTTTLVEAAGTTPVSCGTTPRPWSVALAPATGQFMIGAGEVSAQTASTAGWVTPAAVTGPVRLFLGHR